MTPTVMMKRALLACAVVLGLGCGIGNAQQGTVAVAELQMGKEEGTIDKAFFRKVVADKAPNVAVVDVRTKFEFAAGNFPGSTHVPINDIYSEGCPATIARLPQAGFVVFVCATGARAGEMYFGLKDDCKMDMKRFAFLDAEVMYGPKGPEIK